MSRHPQKPEQAAGSLRWIQAFVNHRGSELDIAIQKASQGRVQSPIHWRSPLAGDDYAEYRDSNFLDLLGLKLQTRSLESFWPRSGPQWDALGIDASGAAVLVESKANVSELVSDPSRASPASLRQIRAALGETVRYLRAESTCDWAGTFYQYANRLAHLYLLQELNGIDAYLVFVYFVGDVDTCGPKTEAEWRAALEVLHGALGLKRHRLEKRVIDVFLEAGY